MPSSRRLEVGRARTAGVIPAGMRLTDHVSLGVLAALFPRELVDQVLFETERLSARCRHT